MRRRRFAPIRVRITQRLRPPGAPKATVGVVLFDFAGALSRSVSKAGRGALPSRFNRGAFAPSEVARPRKRANAGVPAFPALSPHKTLDLFAVPRAPKRPFDSRSANFPGAGLPRREANLARTAPIRRRTTAAVLALGGRTPQPASPDSALAPRASFEDLALSSAESRPGHHLRAEPASPAARTTQPRESKAWTALVDRQSGDLEAQRLFFET